MCINFLILKFLDGHSSGKFDGLKINKHTPAIPILCFADDCIIFCKTNAKSINYVNDTLNLFAKEAGLNINWEKTKDFFSKNTSPHRAKEICHQLNIKKGNMGEKYLGIPFNFHRITKDTFYDIVTKTIKNLQLV